MDMDAQLSRCFGQPLATAHWLPQRFYTDPEIPAQEYERVFYPAWHCVALASSLQSPGDYIAARLFGERVLVVRGEDGAVRTLANTCLHRGMWLAQGEGRTKQFTCPYHRWAYDLDGALIHTPHMDDVIASDDAAACKPALRQYRTEVWNGFVMATLDDSAPSFVQSRQATELGAILEPWNLAELEPALQLSFDVGDWDWKIMVENGIEGYHVLGTHSDSGQPIIPVSRLRTSRTLAESLAGEWTDLRHGYSDEWLDILRQSREKPTAPYAPPPLPGVPDWAFEEMVFLMPFTGFPTVYLTPEAVTSFRFAVDDTGRSQMTWCLHVSPELKNWSGFDEYLAWKKSWIDTIQSEDTEACLGAMEGICSQQWEPFRYSPMEEPVHQFHQWYLSRMLDREVPIHE